MRIALLSDIHGNLAALDAVLADVAARGVTRIANLGDILSGPLQPAATADRLMALDLPTIRGNHERYLLEQDPAGMGPSDAFASSQLEPRHCAWLAGLPGTMWIADDVFACHGTPAVDDAALLETIEPDGAGPASDAEIDERIASIAAAVIVCGHTHLPRLRRLGDGRLLVNPGSVGLQAYAEDHPFPHRMEAGSPHARYALLELGSEGWKAQLHAVSYDWDTAAHQAAQRERPDWARALATGYT